jgi:hypothetical protein
VTDHPFYSATLEVQPANGSEERRKLPTAVHTLSREWLTLITGERLTVFTAVAVEHNDVLFIGEVVRSMCWGNARWAIDIRVAQTLTGLESLMILRAQLDHYQTVREDLLTVEPNAFRCEAGNGR